MVSYIETSTQSYIHLSIPASLNYLAILGPCLVSILSETKHVSDEGKLSYSLELAVYETCTNIVRHAYQHSDGRIELNLKIENQPERLVIDLYDTGTPFKLTDVPTPNLEIPQEHGYGLFLVHQLMDDVSYKSENGKNHWRLIKYL